MFSRLVRAGLFAFLGLVVLAASLTAQELARSVAAQRIELLQVQQCLVQMDVAVLPRTSGPERDQALQTLRETKNRMHEQLVALEGQLGVAQELEPAASRLRESRLAEKLIFSRGTIEQWDDGSVRRLEAIIQQDLAAVRRELAPGARPVECATRA